MTPEQEQRLAEIREQVGDVENKRYFYSSGTTDVTKQRDELHKQRVLLLTLLDQAQRDTERVEKLCGEAHSVFDRIMSDSDRDNDDSPEMKLCQKLAPYAGDQGEGEK